MIQTKRGRDMLLYDGYTFTQNRMCRDGMRWQCSFPKCKAFCRMSSAGWLTPHRTTHEHPKPSEVEIKKRILRMELKARAQSSGATPGEIIRNALPAEEYQTTDQRACYTRCIQRFRKSLQRKNSKPQEDAWQGQSEEKNVQNDKLKATVSEDASWMTQPKPMIPQPDTMKEEVKHWHTHPEPIHLPEQDKALDDKNILHAKMGPYGM